MAQLFHRRSNAIARGSLVVAAATLVAVVIAAYALNASAFVTREGIPREQPVPFSHAHHVSGEGIDCRYCHPTADTGAFAGMPTTETCMTCHRQIWSEEEVLAPVRASWRDETPLRWTRVYDMPDFVYFDHAVHVRRGVGCATCHGDVARMPLTWLAKAWSMSECLECHRHPQPRSLADSYTAPFSVDAPLAERGPEDCYGCHR